MGGDAARTQEAALVAEFTHQAEAFARAAVMRSAETLDALLDALPLTPDGRWCDVACGPGIVAQALARRVATVVGVDLTPAMVDKASAEARAAGLGGVRFIVGDATALPCGDGAFDGAVTRFSLHHIPVPRRVIAEMARVVRPGGTVAAADHLTCADSAGAAWHLEIERLRDPSHWASLPPDTFFGLGADAGLVLQGRRVHRFDLDYAEWLERGSTGAANAALVHELLRRAPAGADEVFGVRGGRLHATLGVAVWRKP